MPGRYLLIEFDDEQSASLLRAQIDTATKKGKKFRVVGLFARPGRTCICVPVRGIRAKDQFQRGSKLGWWLCTSCHKPRLGDHQLHNLITPDEIVDPSLFTGVDTLTPALQVREYFRYVQSLPVITFPDHVAQVKPK